MNYRTPLAKARGLGSAREGADHWWGQRVTAIALFPLTLWFITHLAGLPAASHAEVVEWIAAPWNTIFLLSFVLLSLYHAMLGLRVVIEDYVHNDWVKIFGLLGVRLVTGFLALVTVFAVLRIVFVG